MNAGEILDDLHGRLTGEAERLERLAEMYSEVGSWATAQRLENKARGVRLALSYIHDYNKREQP